MAYAHTKTQSNKNNWLVCGGGRKNKYLLEEIEKNFERISINLIDEYEIDGDFIESQAFAFLAVRSLLRKPISFPTTTGCKDPTIGGIIIENF